MITKLILEVNKDALSEWCMQHQPNPILILATNARIAENTARKILHGRVPTPKVRWLVSLATGIPENILFREKKRKTA